VSRALRLASYGPGYRLLVGPSQAVLRAWGLTSSGDDVRGLDSHSDLLDLPGSAASTSTFRR
jgi:hypothetical protein